MSNSLQSSWVTSTWIGLNSQHSHVWTQYCLVTGSLSQSVPQIMGHCWIMCTLTFHLSLFSVTQQSAISVTINQLPLPLISQNDVTVLKTSWTWYQSFYTVTPGSLHVLSYLPGHSLPARRHLVQSRKSFKSVHTHLLSAILYGTIWPGYRQLVTYYTTDYGSLLDHVYADIPSQFVQCWKLSDLFLIVGWFPSLCWLRKISWLSRHFVHSFLRFAVHDKYIIWQSPRISKASVVLS